MWRLIKAELTYKMWQPMGIYLIGWVMAFSYWRYFSNMGLHRPFTAGGLGLSGFAQATGIVLPLLTLVGFYRNREFKEYRLRTIFPLPVSAKQIAAARILIYMVTHLVALPISFVALYFMGVLQETGVVTKLVTASLIGIILGLEIHLSPELHYIPKWGKPLALLTTGLYFLVLIPLFAIRSAQPLLLKIWGWCQEPLGLGVLVVTAGLFYYFAHLVFMKRRDYSKNYKPVMSIFEMIQSWKDAENIKR